MRHFNAVFHVSMSADTRGQESLDLKNKSRHICPNYSSVACTHAAGFKLSSSKWVFGPRLYNSTVVLQCVHIIQRPLNYTVFQKKHPLILLAISWGIVVRF